MSAGSRPRTAIGVGITTLVTIIVAVLLTTFSVLTLVTARADLRLSNKAIESTQSYYTADSEAEQWLAVLDNFVIRSHVDLLRDLNSAGYKVSTAVDGRILVTESFFMDSKRDLLVEVAIDSNGRIDILTWKTISKR